MEDEVDWKGWERLMQLKLPEIRVEIEKRMNVLSAREQYEVEFKNYPPRIEVSFGAAATRRDPHFGEKQGRIIFEVLTEIVNSYDLAVKRGYRKFDDAPWARKMKHFYSDYDFTIQPVDYSDGMRA